MTTEPYLSVKNLTVAFDEPVVKNVSFNVFPGKTTAIVGESGSGKTIMSMAILGLLPKSASIRNGEVRGPDGEVWAGANCENDVPVGREISMVFQDSMSSLNPSMVVGEQVAEPLIVHKLLDRKAARKEVLNLLEEVELPQPEIAFGKFPHELSGGQKQRVMIAMALACSPQILIADEPTTALDVTVQKTILQLIKRLQNKRNIGLLFISHDLDVVRDIADYIVVMKKGEVVEKGYCREVMSNPEHAYTRELMDARPTRERFGRGRDNEGDNYKTDKTEILMEVKGVSLDYVTKRNWLGDPVTFFEAVKNVSFKINSGERVGLVGESGSGKSSLGKVLLGMEKATNGEIIWKGLNLDLDYGAMMAEFKKDAQPVFQDPFSALNPRMKIGKALQEAIDLGPGNINVKELLEEVGLNEADSEKFPGAFSGGQRQRIVLARALAIEPEFLVLDESVAALDLRIQSEILQLLMDIQKKRSFSFLFISHDLSVIEAICDRILIMKDGEIIESGLTKELFRNPENQYTKSLLESRPGLQRI